MSQGTMVLISNDQFISTCQKIYLVYGHVGYIYLINLT